MTANLLSPTWGALCPSVDPLWTGLKHRETRTWGWRNSTGLPIKPSDWANDCHTATIRGGFERTTHLSPAARACANFLFFQTNFLFYYTSPRQPARHTGFKVIRSSSSSSSLHDEEVSNDDINLFFSAMTCVWVLKLYTSLTKNHFSRISVRV